jgi:hypothetical protein
VLLESIHALGNLNFWELTATCIMVVGDCEAELRGKHHSLGEHSNELGKRFLVVGCLGIVHKNYAVSFLLNWAPAFLIFKITGNVPQLKSELAETGNRRWGISLELNNTTANSGSILLGGSFSELTDNVCKC